MRVCMRVRMIVRTPQEAPATERHRKERNTGNTGKLAYIGKIAYDKKKCKKFKKNLEILKSRRIFVAVIKQQTHRKGKRKYKQ